MYHSLYLHVSITIKQHPSESFYKAEIILFFRVRKIVIIISRYMGTEQLAQMTWIGFMLEGLKYADNMKYCLP